MYLYSYINTYSFCLNAIKIIIKHYVIFYASGHFCCLCDCKSGLPFALFYGNFRPLSAFLNIIWIILFLFIIIIYLLGELPELF